MQTNTAESYRSAQDRKLNGPRGFGTSAGTTFNDETGAYMLSYRMYWRAAVDGRPGFNFKVTYHGR